MGDYIGQSDIEDQFGTRNVKKWSNLDNTEDSVDSTRITAAIAYAEGHVNDRFRNSMYAVSLTGSSGSLPKCVIYWCAILAGWWLYSSRGLRDEDEGEHMNALKEEVDRQITLVLGGGRWPALMFTETMSTSPIVIQ